MSETRESLQLSVTQLQEELEETKNNLFKAAECGNTLLGTNQLLNDKLEAREKEYAEQLEVSYVSSQLTACFSGVCC